jgi:archaellum biogenesis ATPase FlaH
VTTGATEFLDSVKWHYRPSGSGDNQAVEVCPFCKNSNFKFFINSSGTDKDGLWSCKVCGKAGNLYQLKEAVGVTKADFVSMQDAARAAQPARPLPDFNKYHADLFTPEFDEVYYHLRFERGYSEAVIKEQRLGALERDGEKWYVIPYYDPAGQPVFYKIRNLPGAKKKFGGPSGRECPLFNERSLIPGLDVFFLVEGEADCLTLLSQDIKAVAGVPGAGVKKATWIEKLDRCAPKNLYLLYDSDKPGQTAAREMAIRIGIDRVKNICLPPFKFKDYDGVEKDGKDINEWFRAGHTQVEFLQLAADATSFDVEGVQPISKVLEDFRYDLETNGLEPAFKSPWPSLDKRLGGAEEGDVIGLMGEGKSGKSTMALDWLDFYSTMGHNVMMYCEEMLPKRIVRKWVSYVTQTDDKDLTPEAIDQALLVAAERPGDFLFAYTPLDTKTVMDTIRQAVRRYGVKIVCFDHLQLLVRSNEHAVQEINNITKQFKELALELKIVLILIVQPNRVAEGSIVSSRNANGSSAIEKLVDAMVCIHRNRVGVVKQADFTGYLDTEENFEPNMLVRVDLSRYSAGGVCTLFFDGATSTVREFTQDESLVTRPNGGATFEAAQV